MSATYDETYTEYGDVQARAGGFLVTAISILAGILVIAGLIYATGASGRHKAAILAAGCEPSLFISGLPCTTWQMVLSQYEAIVNPASKLLTADVAVYNADEVHHLVTAEAALTAEVAVEQSLDNSLAAVTFTPQNRARALSLITNAASTGLGTVPPDAVTLTPQMTVIADAVIRADQALAKLTAEQARSSSLTQLWSFNTRVGAARTAVQTEMKLLGKAVATPVTAR